MPVRKWGGLHKHSLRQQADVRLSDIAAEWLENRFQKTKLKFGSIPQDFIDSLYQGSPTLKDIIKHLPPQTDNEYM